VEERLERHLAQIAAEHAQQQPAQMADPRPQQPYVACGALRSAPDARHPFADLVGQAPFSTALLPMQLVSPGAWMYEAVLGSSGLLQLGFAWPLSAWDAENGVGDFHATYAYDGKRVCRWGGGGSAPFGEPWVAGDVIGCCLRLRPAGDPMGGSVEFYRNGRLLGTAFGSVAPRPFYVAGLSISEGERAFINSGNVCPFFYPIPGFEPVRPPPPAAELAKTRYLVGCVRRLLLHREELGGHDCCSLAESGDDAVIALTQISNALFPLMLGSP